MHPKKAPQKNLERLKGAFFQIGLIISLVAILLAFQWKVYNRSEIIIPHATEIIDVIEMIPITIPKPPPPTDLAQIDIVKNNEPVEIPELKFNTEGTEKLVIADLPPVLQVPEKCEDPNTIFVAVEQMPEFPGGNRVLFEYLSKNVKYPRLAQEIGIRGTVYVSFVVEPDGSISNVKVLRGIGGGCDEEALRLFSNMPRWQPGMQSGRPVRVSFSASITFRLD
jgi:periplasmic protein TonB